MPVLQIRKQVQRRKALCPQSPLALKREGPPPTSSFPQVTLAAHFSRLRELLWGLFFNHVTSPWYHLQADVSGEGPGVRRGLITELGVSTQRRPRRKYHARGAELHSSGGLGRSLNARVPLQPSAKFPPCSGLHLLCC